MLRKLILSLFLTTLCVSNGFAVIIPASTCEQAEIEPLLAGASSGDTITVPAGACTWTSVVTIPAGVTLQGAGIGSTIIDSSSFLYHVLADGAVKGGHIIGFQFNNGWAAGLSGYRNWVAQDCSFDDPIRRLPAIQAGSSKTEASSTTITIPVTFTTVSTVAFVQLASTSSAPTSVTLNSLAMTALYSSDRRNVIYYRAKGATAAGTYNIVATYSSAQKLVGQTFTISNTEGPHIEAITTNTASASSISVTTSHERNDLVIGFLSLPISGATPSSGQTDVSSVNDGTNYLYVSTKPGSDPATSTTMGWSWSGSQSAHIGAVAIRSNVTSVSMDATLLSTETSGVFHGCIFEGKWRFTSFARNGGTNLWAADTDLGGTNNIVYFESCTLNGGASGNSWDSRCGGGFVIRFNTINNSSHRSHGSRYTTPATQSQAGRGTRRHEMYRNTMNYTLSYSAGGAYSGWWIRSGVGMMFDNYCTGGTNCAYLIDNERCSNGSSFYACDADGGDQDTFPHPGTGTDYMCRDSTGAGKDVDLGGFVVTEFNQYDQTYEPSYFWKNLHNGGTANVQQVNLDNCGNVIIEDRDYFLDASTSANYGNGGVTTGTWENRPPTCTRYNGYWATNMGGNWNTTDEWSGEDGALYVCNLSGTAENTWELYYTPAVYPHPLVTTSVSTPTIPGGVTISGGTVK